MAIKFRRKRTSIKIVKYAIYLYLSGLSLREKGVGRSHEAVRRWVKRLGLRRNRVEKPKARAKAETIYIA